MTTANQNATKQDTTQTTASNRPAFEAVIPITGENGDTTWQKIGAAWEAKSGFNLVLTELPFTPDGKQAIYLRARQPFNKAVKTEQGT